MPMAGSTPAIATMALRAVCAGAMTAIIILRNGHQTQLTHHRLDPIQHRPQPEPIQLLPAVLAEEVVVVAAVAADQAVDTKRQTAECKRQTEMLRFALPY